MKRRKTKKVKMVRILGETVRKGGVRYRFLLDERRNFLRRQRDPESSYYGVPISELLKSNRRRTKRCWKGYSPVKGMRPYSKGSCRKVRMNKMRSRNSMGQKLYVVITADGTPLSGRIGTLEPPGPILYTKGEAIKKGRMFRGRVVSVENYYKMRPGLRRNPMSYHVGGLSSLGAKGEARRQARIFNQIKKSVEAESVSFGEIATLASLARSHPKLFIGEPRMAEVAGMTEARYRRLRGNPPGLGNLTHNFLSLIDMRTRQAILKNIADHYGISMEQAYREITDEDAEHLLDYVTGPTRYAVQALMKRYRM